MYILIDNVNLIFKYKHADLSALLKIASDCENERDCSLFSISDNLYYRYYTTSQLRQLYKNMSGKVTKLRTRSILEQKILKLAKDLEPTKFERKRI